MVDVLIVIYFLNVLRCLNLYVHNLYLIGLTIHTFHGNFFVRSTDLLSLPNVNPDTGYAMQIAIEESLTEYNSVCFQAAVLYTSSNGNFFL